MKFVDKLRIGAVFTSLVLYRGNFRCGRGGGNRDGRQVRVLRNQGDFGRDGIRSFPVLFGLDKKDQVLVKLVQLVV